MPIRPVSDNPLGDSANPGRESFKSHGASLLGAFLALFRRKGRTQAEVEAEAVETAARKAREDARGEGLPLEEVTRRGDAAAATLKAKIEAARLDIQGHDASTHGDAER